MKRDYLLLDFELKEMVEEKFQIFDRYTQKKKKRDFSNCRTIVSSNKHTCLECEHLVTLNVQRYAEILGKRRD